MTTTYTILDLNIDNFIKTLEIKENYPEQNENKSFNLNTFLGDLRARKKHMRSVKKFLITLTEIKEKNHKSMHSRLFSENIKKNSECHFVTHIIDIRFARSNTFLHVTDFAGKSRFFYSAGSLKYAGKSKRARYKIFKDLLGKLVYRLKFLRGTPLALHLKNVGYSRSWILRKLKDFFFIKFIHNFSYHPHNGCRKRKVRRKKFKKR